MSSDPQQFLDVAIEAAQQAGSYLLENQGKLLREHIDEKNANDFVTYVDKGAEKIIIDHILARFPAHSILAEESGKSQQNSDFQWIIDPLDGTTNYIRNIPIYAVSIALQHHSELIAGVIFNPAEDELFCAAKDGGATLNKQQIRISETQDFSKAFLATGFPHHAKRYLPPFTRSFHEIFYASAGVRRLGAAALDMCYTACGRFDGYWELGLHAWDIAAGSIIVREAGGIVTDFWGNNAFLDSGFLIAGNSTIHERIKSTLNIYFRRQES